MEWIGERVMLPEQNNKRTESKEDAWWIANSYQSDVAGDVFGEIASDVDGESVSSDVVHVTQ